jgi:hypothetical protein
MALNILFVSEQYMRDNLPISKNLDTKDIKPNIQSSQELYTQDILGSDFYEDLQTKFSAQTLNNEEIVLVQEYIKPAIAYRALGMALPFLAFNIKNKGPQQQSDDFSTSAPGNELRFLISNVENRAEFYENRLVKYLCKNGNLFPLYKSQSDAIIQPNNKNGWENGLIFY